jgi:hypothetical protein
MPGASRWRALGPDRHCDLHLASHTQGSRVAGQRRVSRSATLYSDDFSLNFPCDSQGGKLIDGDRQAAIK